MNNEDEELLEQWFLTRNLSKGTQVNYRIAIRDFSELIGKSPSELIDEAEIEEDGGIRPRKRKVNSYLLQYKKQLEDKVAPSTVNLYFSAIKSFYKAFDITLPEIKLDKGDIGLEKNIGKPLTRLDILRLVSAAPIRERAIIYLMTMSGMGQQEVRDLTIKKYLISAGSSINKDLSNVEDLFKNENEILNEVITLEIRRRKVNYQHHTFIPPEVSREIIGYLKERCYGRNDKIRIKTNNEPIFVNNSGEKISRDSIVTNFRRIGQDAGFQKEEGSYAYWRSHALRKYFISTIINKIAEKVIADYMAGHKINNQDRTYWQANPEDLKQHYLKALPYLSLDQAKVKDFKSKEYRKIQKELESNKKESEERIQKLEEKEEKRDKYLKELERRLLREEYGFPLDENDDPEELGLTKVSEDENYIEIRPGVYGDKPKKRKK